MEKRFSKILFVFALVVILLTACGVNTESGQTVVEAGENYYIENKGSDTIVNLALYWAEAYQALHPEVQISVTGGGSGTGISALINNTVDLANASREIKAEEIENAQANGVDPVEFIVARDAIAVIVNPENPISELTLQEISDIYTEKISNWSELGGEDRPIVRLSRETNSGTHVYFLEEVIRLGNSDDKSIFSANTLLLPSSEGIIAEVSANPNAIGYDGLGYITEEVKVLSVAKDENSDYIYPSLDTVNENLYAISRNLYIYSNGTPTSYVQEYLDWIMSPDGQKIVADLGFIPIK